MRHEKIVKDGSFEAVDLADYQIDLPSLPEPFRSAAAAPDIPPAVGQMLVFAFASVLATFAITMAHSRESLFALAICGFFLTMYLSVPRIFLLMEPKQGKRPSFGIFIDKGLDTYTGHCSGRDALLQILIVPVLLTFGALAMGIVALTAL